MKIPLTQNRHAIIDDIDFESVNRYKWSLSTNGDGNYYASAWIDSKNVRLHRFLLSVKDRNVHVDHINGDGLDNRRENIRICNNFENRRNSKISKRNSTGFKGVRTRKDINVYQAGICFNRKYYYLGYYKTAEEAARAYDKKARELHGRFAKLNFPDES